MSIISVKFKALLRSCNRPNLKSWLAQAMSTACIVSTNGASIRMSVRFLPDVGGRPKNTGALPADARRLEGLMAFAS